MTHLRAKEGEATFWWSLFLKWLDSAPSSGFQQLQIKVSYVKHKSWAATLFSSREQSLSKNNVQMLTTGAGPHKIRSFGAAPYRCIAAVEQITPVIHLEVGCIKLGSSQIDFTPSSIFSSDRPGAVGLMDLVWLVFQTSKTKIHLNWPSHWTCIIIVSHKCWDMSASNILHHIQACQPAWGSNQGASPGWQLAWWE